MNPWPTSMITGRTPNGSIRAQVACHTRGCPRRLTGTGPDYGTAYATLAARMAARGWTASPLRCPAHATPGA